MKARVAINGFGRIGRQFLKASLERHPEVEIVALNDLADPKMNAHLFKHDSNYGKYQGEVSATADSLIVDGRSIKVLQERDPAKLPWKDLEVDIVVESTGFFTDATKAKAHLDAGAKYVIISAPAKNEDKTIVLGVNEKEFDPEKHHIISNASCTTNGLAPVAKVLNDEFGIEKGFLTTIHSKTLSQRLLDTVAADPRDARAASENIVPAETGAARAVTLWLAQAHTLHPGQQLVPDPRKVVDVVDHPQRQSIETRAVQALHRFHRVIIAADQRKTRTTDEPGLQLFLVVGRDPGVDPLTAEIECVVGRLPVALLVDVVVEIVLGFLLGLTAHDVDVDPDPRFTAVRRRHRLEMVDLIQPSNRNRSRDAGDSGEVQSRLQGIEAAVATDFTIEQEMGNQQTSCSEIAKRFQNLFARLWPRRVKLRIVEEGVADFVRQGEAVARHQ